MKLGHNYKILKDIPTVDGVLYKGTIVKILNVKSNENTVKVKDPLGKIWYVDSKNIIEYKI